MVPSWINRYNAFRANADVDPFLLFNLVEFYPEYLERSKRVILERGNYDVIHRAFVLKDWWEDTNFFIESLVFFRKGRKDIMLDSDKKLLLKIADELPNLTEDQREWLRINV